MSETPSKKNIAPSRIRFSRDCESAIGYLSIIAISSFFSGQAFRNGEWTTIFLVVFNLIMAVLFSRTYKGFATLGLPHRIGHSFIVLMVFFMALGTSGQFIFVFYAGQCVSWDWSNYHIQTLVTLLFNYAIFVVLIIHVFLALKPVKVERGMYLFFVTAFLLALIFHLLGFAAATLKEIFQGVADCPGNFANYALYPWRS